MHEASFGAPLSSLHSPAASHVARMADPIRQPSSRFSLRGGAERTDEIREHAGLPEETACEGRAGIRIGVTD